MMFVEAILLGFKIGIIALSALIMVLAGLFVLYCGLAVIRGLIKGFSKPRE